MQASGKVCPDALQLARVLLAEYIHRFIGPTPRMSAELSLLTGQAVDREQGLAAIGELASDPAERRWLVHSLLATAGIDQEFPEPEQQFVSEALKLLGVPLARP